MPGPPRPSTAAVEPAPTVGLVVTGGVGTGKSTFARQLADLVPGLAAHDADAAVHALYGDAEVRAGLAGLFGPEVLVSATDIDRAAVRRAIFAEPAKRTQLEAILHPRVRASCLAAWEAAVVARKPLFLAEIPLYFEGGQWKPDPAFRVVVVACSPGVQRERLAARNPFDNNAIESIISVQADLAAKMAAADFVVWNEGRSQALLRQATLLVGHLIPRTHPV